MKDYCHSKVRAGIRRLNINYSRCKAAIAAAVRAFLFLLPIVCAIVPICLLVGYSSTLSRALGESGCLPNGEFVLPYTSSVWNPRLFFVITVPIGNRFCMDDDCFLPSLLFPPPSLGLSCGGYSFTSMNVTDVAWDLLVGRGGQLIYGVVAYRLFSRTIRTLVQREEVTFESFAAVTFESGNITSLGPLCRNLVARSPRPYTRRAKLAYLSMALGTLYVVSLPTFLSAMTGYTSYSTPAVSGDVKGKYSFKTHSCGNAIIPAWGQVNQDMASLHRYPLTEFQYPVITFIIPYEQPWKWNQFGLIECKFSSLQYA